MRRSQRERLIRLVDGAETFSTFFVIADVNQLNVAGIVVCLNRAGKAAIVNTLEAVTCHRFGRSRLVATLSS